MQKKGIDENDVKYMLTVLETNDVAALISPTGSSKSTLFVKYLYQNGKTVFITNPTVPSTSNLASYMKTQLGENTVESAFDSKISYKNKIIKYIRSPSYTQFSKEEDTPIVYATATHIKRLFLDLVKNSSKTDDLKFCDILFLDEAHSGSIDNIIIMTLWKLLCDKGKKLPKLLLVSATLDISKTIFPESPCYTIKVQSFPVKIIYHTKDYLPDDDNIITDMASVILNYHTKNLSMLEDKGDVWLAFLAGSSEIEKLYILLNSKREDLVVYSLYSSQNERQEDLFEMPIVGKRKIILSTNIAETSITINNLTAVFDSCVEKISETSNNGGPKLQVTNISKSSAIQRAGRTGRTCEGFCYRMCTESLYETFCEQRLPEILRVPLHSTIIDLLNVGIDPEDILPKESKLKINKTKDILVKLQMIKLKPLKVLPIGQFASIFPITVYSSSILYKWYFDNPYEYIFSGVVLCAIIDGFNQSQLYLYYPKKDYNTSNKEYDIIVKKHYYKYFKKYDGDNDLEVVLNIFKHLFEYIEYNLKNTKKICEYNVYNSLNNKKMLEVINIINQIINKFNTLDIKVSLEMLTSKEIIKKITPIFLEIYNTFTFKTKNFNLVYSPSSSSSKGGGGDYILDKRLPISSNTKIHDKIIGILLTEIQNKLNEEPKKYISLSLPI